MICEADESAPEKRRRQIDIGRHFPFDTGATKKSVAMNGAHLISRSCRAANADTSPSAGRKAHSQTPLQQLLHVKQHSCIASGIQLQAQWSLSKPGDTGTTKGCVNERLRSDGGATNSMCAFHFLPHLLCHQTDESLCVVDQQIKMPQEIQPGCRECGSVTVPPGW